MRQNQEIAPLQLGLTAVSNNVFPRIEVTGLRIDTQTKRPLDREEWGHRLLAETAKMSPLCRFRLLATIDRA
jgi:hypothetical protein